MSPHVAPIAPALLWQAACEGWSIAAYRHIPGRPWADQRPRSPDMVAITAVLRALEAIPAPPALTLTAADCWGPYADDPRQLVGNALAHRDPNPANFIIGEDGRAWLVDWGWAVRGPVWLTPALLVLSLMEAGHDPAAAEAAVANLPGWRAAPARALAGFAAANARMWDEAEAAAPGWPRDYRADIARQWAACRGGGSPT